MKKRTTELIRKALGTDSDAPNRVKKTFTTGMDIEKECEDLEHLIEEEGEEVFLQRVKKVINKRDADGQKKDLD